MKKKIFAILMAVTIITAMAVPAFAAEGEYVGVTSEMLEPVLEGAKANLGVIVPVAIGLFAIMLGIGFIPVLFKKFRKG